MINRPFFYVIIVQLLTQHRRSYPVTFFVHTVVKDKMQSPSSVIISGCAIKRSAGKSNDFIRIIFICGIQIYPFASIPAIEINNVTNQLHILSCKSNRGNRNSPVSISLNRIVTALQVIKTWVKVPLRRDDPATASDRSAYDRARAARNRRFCGNRTCQQRGRYDDECQQSFQQLHWYQPLTLDLLVFPTE